MGDYSQEDDHSDKYDNLKWLANRGKSITLDGEPIGGVSGSSASLKFNITDKIKKYSGKTATFQFGAFFTSKGSGTATTGGLIESLGYVYHIKNLRIVIER
jgi:hypothetical protein